MEWLNKNDVKNASRVGLVMGGVSIVIAFILKWIKLPHVIFSTVQDINVRSQLEQGVSADVGNKIFSWIGGVISTDNFIVGILAVLVSSVIIFVIGAQALRLVTSMNFRKPEWAVVSAGVLGSLVVGIVFGGLLKLFSLDSLISYITLALYFFVVSWIAGKLAPKVGVKPDF